MVKTRKNEKSVLAKNIIARRKAIGWKSAEKFAEAAGIPYPTLRDIEADLSSGRKSTLEAIAKKLKCTLSDLYSDPNAQTPDTYVSIREMKNEFNEVIDRMSIWADMSPEEEKLLELWKRSDSLTQERVLNILKGSVQGTESAPHSKGTRRAKGGGDHS